jgi:hypothetical protein
MDVYFSPLACSMASRITLYEAGAPAHFIEVDPKTKRTLNGDNFFEINPLGLVPTIRIPRASRQSAANGSGLSYFDTQSPTVADPSCALEAPAYTEASAWPLLSRWVGAHRCRRRI